MYCTSCGTPIEPEASFCIRCGVAVEADSDVSPAASSMAGGIPVDIFRELTRRGLSPESARAQLLSIKVGEDEALEGNFSDVTIKRTFAGDPWRYYGWSSDSDPLLLSLGSFGNRHGKHSRSVGPYSRRRRAIPNRRPEGFAVVRAVATGQPVCRTGPCDGVLSLCDLLTGSQASPRAGLFSPGLRDEEPKGH